MNQIGTMSVNAVRILAADAVQKVKSGHPGPPLGAAAMSFGLWTKHMNHNPKNPGWENRDRFILSRGHGSTLLHSPLYLFGCGLTEENVMNFRQMDSLTPEHPEYGHTIGVEATAGPLGTGMDMAVGMAMTESYSATVFNKNGYPVVDHFAYVLDGDGCVVEGISSEALSLADTLGLDKLIIFYDSNRISIEGGTGITSTEDIQRRVETFGFQLTTVKDGDNLDTIGKAIEKAKADTTRPSFITVKAQTGYGCPTRQGKTSAYGGPLGDDNVKTMRKLLNWPSMEPFYVPDEVYVNYKAYAEGGVGTGEKWNALFVECCGKYPEMKELWDRFYNLNLTSNVYDSKNYWAFEDRPDATRSLSGKQLQKLKNLMSDLVGGAVDLAPSAKAYMADMGDFSKNNYVRCNLHFGVRELAMSAIGNSLMLHGDLRIFVSTFFVFSSYIKPMAGLSTLVGMPLTYVFTHDSIDVGEDGPTHEPIEQPTMLHATPSFHAYRPAGATETAAARYNAVSSKKTSAALVLTRQNLSQLAGSSKEALKGVYILEDSAKEAPDAIIIATGSGVELAVGAKAELAKEGMNVRIVSMPSVDVFEKRPEDYREKVLPKTMRKRVAVEALGDFGWGRYVGLGGTTVTMKEFSANAPTGRPFKKSGFTVENVTAAMKSLQT